MSCYSTRENEYLRALLALEAQEPDTPGWRKAWRRYCEAVDALKRYQ